MKKIKVNSPPLAALKFFRWFCHPEFREEIEGDLLEMYHKNLERFGARKARALYFKEVLFLFRPSIIGNLHHFVFKLLPEMKRSHWIQLVILNLLMILCIVLPYLPGPYDKLSLAISVAAQLSGYVGLLLIPVAILWLIQEKKKLTGNSKESNKWNNGYYYAMTALCICTFLGFVFILILLISVGISASIIALTFILFALFRQISAIKKLKNRDRRTFNAAPLYLLSTPLIAFTVCIFFIGPVSEHSRNYAIKQAQELITDIENYRIQNGSYPQSIEYVTDISKPSVMGISEFIYELNGDAYNLAFVQHQHFGATREVVMYNKNDEHNVKGYFANYSTSQLHWKYYWLD